MTLDSKIKTLEIARERNIMTEAMYVTLSSEYSRLVSTENSLSVLEEALEKEISGPDIFANLLDCHFDKGNINQGILLGEHAIDIGQVNLLLYFNLSLLYDENKQYVKSLDILLQAQKIYSDNDELNARIIEHKYFIKHKLFRDWSEEIVFNKTCTNALIYNVCYMNLLQSRPILAEAILKKAVRENYADSMTYNFLIGSGYRKHIKDLKEIAENVSLNKDYAVFIYLSELVKNRLIPDSIPHSDYLKELVTKLVENNEFLPNLKNICRASHEIKKIDFHEFSSHFIIKKSDFSFEQEIEIRNMLEEILENTEILPREIASFELNGNYYYIMERKEGKTLTNLIASNKPPAKLYDTILRTLAKIHAGMHSEKKYDFDIKLHEKVLKAELDSGLVEAAQPIIKILKNSKHWSYNKDACTDNWIVGDRTNDSFFICDTENRGEIPCAVDLAHFLNFIPYKSTINQRLVKVNHYLNYFNKECELRNRFDLKINDTNEFIKEYCNGVIYRAIANYGYLFSKNRPEHSKIVAITGIEMVNYMLKSDLIAPDDKNNYLFIKNVLSKEL